jgi:hypothetical protein
MRPSPQSPDSPPWQCGGRVLVGGVDRGAGVAVGSRLVLTARHVVGTGKPDVPIIFKTLDGHHIDVSSPILFAKGQDAAALKLAEDVAWSPAANAKAAEPWSVRPTGRSNDPVLTGTITAIGLPLEDAKGNPVTAMQLQVDQELGDFKGYSGSAVLNEQWQVTGLLIEQKLQRLNVPRPAASNVLFALPISDVAKRLQIDLDLPRPTLGVYLRESFAPLIENYTKFFAGRDDVMDKLDQFMLRPEGGYLVITAPAGFGKTAIAARLANREPGRIAYHFFSRLYGSGGLDERFFLQDVVQQLTLLDGREEQTPESIEQLRALYHHLLSQSARDSRVLVLDGLDEITAWDITPYLSRHLPANTHVILTVRDVGQDWVTAYGIPADQATHLELDGLSREELGAALRQVGGQGVVLADDDSLLDQVVQVAAYGADPDLGADPFFVRFLLEDAAVGRLTPQSLAQQPPGMEAYLDKWWNELSALAGDEPARDFFGSLMAALGPIYRADLAQINPSLRATGGWDGDPFDTVLARARRMVSGNEEEGYALISPRLNAYGRTKINTSVYADRILSYCADWQENKSSYALAHYAQHLLQAGQKEALCGLVSKAWIEARSQQSTYHAPAGDVQLVIEAAQSEQPPNLTQEVRHSLIYATLGSFTTRLTPEGFNLLAQFGADKEARAIASLLQDDESRLKAQIAVGTGLLARGEGDIARSELRQAMRIAEPWHLSELAPAMARLGNFDEVETTLARVTDQDLRTRSIVQCAVALAGDGQSGEAFALAGTLDVGLPRIEVLADVARALAESGEPRNALTAADAAASAAETIADPETKARALALAARAFALAGAVDRAEQVAAAGLAALAETAPDWRMMETVCVAAQALAPGGQITDAVQAADRIAQGVAASKAFTSTGHEVYGHYDLRGEFGSFTGGEEEPPDSGRTEFDSARAIKSAAGKRRDSVIAARLTFRNLASPTADTELIVVAPMTSTDEARTNAISWLAQSLTEAHVSLHGPGIADSLLTALDHVAPEPTSIRAVAQGYVALLMAKAGDKEKASGLVTETFATLRTAGLDIGPYMVLLRAVAPALQIIGDTEGTFAAIRNLTQTFQEEDEIRWHTNAVAKEIARQLLQVGDIPGSLAFGFSIVTTISEKAAFLNEVIAKLRASATPDDISTYVGMLTDIDKAYVNELPPDFAQSVLASAAGAITGIEDFDRAAGLLERMLEAGVVAPDDTIEKMRAFIEIAGVLAGAGETEKSRMILSEVFSATRDARQEIAEKASKPDSSFRNAYDLERVAKLCVRAAPVLDQIGDFDAAKNLLSALGKQWTNISYAMSDHVAALALAGHLDQALESAAWVDLPAIKASGLSQIAAAMALAGDERAQEIAEEALQVLGEDHPAAGHMHAETRDTRNETHWWLDPGDQELKEGSWLLSRAVRSLPPAGGNRKLPDSVASAVATAGTAESPWMRSLGLDDILKLILTGETDAAVAKLTELRAKAASSSDDFQRTRSMRWVAELLIRLGETTIALAIARDISEWNESGNSSDTAEIREWVADTLGRLSEALSAAADDAAATEVAEAAMRAGRIEDEGVRPRAEVRVIRTYAAIGQYHHALARWHDDLAVARASGRRPLFDLIGAEASALAAHDQGLTLWNIYEAVNEVEAWWGTLQLA